MKHNTLQTLSVFTSLLSLSLSYFSSFLSLIYLPHKVLPVAGKMGESFCENGAFIHCGYAGNQETEEKSLFFRVICPRGQSWQNML